MLHAVTIRHDHKTAVCFIFSGLSFILCFMFEEQTSALSKKQGGYIKFAAVFYTGVFAIIYLVLNASKTITLMGLSSSILGNIYYHGIHSCCCFQVLYT